MPEGDTLRKLVRLLTPELVGRTLVAGRLPRRPQVELAGRRVTEVYAVGKHLYIALAADLLLRTHLGMHGSWHRYPPGGTWQRPPGQAWVVLETDSACLVCFNAAQAELVRDGGLRDRAQRNRLGPDLSDPGTDPADVAHRAAALCPPDTLLVDLLLDQGIACGIGNVYKSELLFLHRLSPFGRLAALDGEGLTALYRQAGELLRANAGSGPRRTRFAAEGPGLWVYRRAGRCCLRCGARIRSGKLGRGSRGTYWCPVCQREGRPGGLA